MARVSGNHPVQLNSLDQLFHIKGSDSTVHDQMAINTGLLKGFGKDEAVTYLLTHIKNDSQEVHITRGSNGHLTWTIGDKQLNIGSSLWERLKHKMKMAFSADYRKNLGVNLELKIEKIERAYLRCIANEIDADVNSKDAAADDLEIQRKAQEKLDADTLQQAEVIRLSKEAKDQKIVDLGIKIIANETELASLEIDRSQEKALEIESTTKKAQYESDKSVFNVLDEYKLHLAELNNVIKAYENITFEVFNTVEEERIIQSGEKLLGISLRSKEAREHKATELTTNIGIVERINVEIATLDKEIKVYQTNQAALATKIAEKEAELNRLNDEFKAEEEIVPEVVEDVVPDLIVVQDDKLKDAKDVSAAMDRGLSQDEVKLYASLNAQDRVHYDWIRKPADGAIDCSTIADFMLTLIKARDATRVGPAIKLNPGVVNIQLGGNHAIVTLPANFKMAYAVDKQAWALEGKGLRMKMKGYDVNLDGSHFEIHDTDFNIRLNSSKQSFGVKLAMGLAYPKGIAVPFDVVHQDVFHSNSNVI